MNSWKISKLSCVLTQGHRNKNRTAKIKYQRKQLDKGKKIFGITELRSHLNSELGAYNLLYEEKKEEELQDTDPKEYPLINGMEFDTIEYPKVDYIQNPIFLHVVLIKSMVGMKAAKLFLV